MIKKPQIFLYLLGFYVILQFSWWGYLLIQLTSELEQEKFTLSTKVLMIIGEGLVFFLILMLGFWRLWFSMTRDQLYTERQKNFMLSITHELKTPIASNKLLLQTLLKRNLSHEKQIEFIQKALQDNDRLQEIVESILVATQLENHAIRSHREIVVLNDVFQELITHFQQIDPTAEFVLEAPETVKVHADLFMVKTIMRNLIENALKYAKDAGPIILYIQSHDHNIKFGVRDLGPGVPNEMKYEIFKKFYRLENEETRRQKGTGLGLFIASEFSKLSGGKLYYLPNEKQGSIFEVVLY